ncbi:tyrosine-type recombinase/integrase [Idiomarina sp.]|jgi:integrase|uniref:tyrosine-type recombinase/integrase n=1 Tax=Idiomarina sp. TaxID=1874361 RepID=UPI0035133A8F
MPKKCFIVVGDIIDGIIIDKNGNPFPPFRLFVEHALRKGLATNTVKVYAEHVLRFLNYYFRALELTVHPIDRSQLRHIVHSYSSYLLHATDSPNEIASVIAKENQRTAKLQVSSLGVIDNAISYFIRLGELLQEEKYYTEIAPLFDAFISPRTAAEMSKIQENSVMAGVIRGGLSNKERVKYGVTMLQNAGKKGAKPKKYITRSIELDLIGDVIDSASNLRDKTYYSLLAASGCRSHEALQVRLEDINIGEKEVMLRSPFVSDMNQLGLTIKEQQQLSWKGRQTETTFLIEPFKSMFFNYLRQYIKEKRISTCGHTFILQNERTFRPYFCSDRSTRIKRFKSALTRAGILDTSYLSPHSLRHSYGFYTLNYIPISDGVFGLPLPYVQQLMGHSSISSTKIYSKVDENLVKEHVNYANNLMFGESSINVNDIRIKFYENKLKEIKNQLEKFYQLEDREVNV